MLNYKKLISISLSPNVEKDDVFLALSLLVKPWKWKQGKEIGILEKEFANYLGVKYAISFNSGRSSLYAILIALGLEKNSDVLLQAFTCNAVPNPILWAELNPIYIDCNQENFNMDLSDLTIQLAKLDQNGQRPKVLIIQHTFGLPANMAEVLKIAKDNGLFVIEDCAHALGAECNGSRVGLPAEALAKAGTFGDAAFFSFSRDKVISSVYGGMVVTNNDQLREALLKVQSKMSFPNLFWIKQQLLHPVLLHYFVLPWYNFLSLGKIFLVALQILHILSKAVSWQEKKGKKPDYFPKAFPNALAIMALHQFKKLNKFQAHRKKLFNYYYKNLENSKFVLPQKPENIKQSYLRFVVKHPEAHNIIYTAWHKENILLGDWYTTPIAPFDTNIKLMRYKEGSCLNAEILSEVTLNLPTHINITEKDAGRIINFLSKWK